MELVQSFKRDVAVKMGGRTGWGGDAVGACYYVGPADRLEKISFLYLLGFFEEDDADPGIDAGGTVHDKLGRTADCRCREFSM